MDKGYISFPPQLSKRFLFSLQHWHNNRCIFLCRLSALEWMRNSSFSQHWHQALYSRCTSLTDLFFFQVLQSYFNNRYNKTYFGYFEEGFCRLAHGGFSYSSGLLIHAYCLNFIVKQRIRYLLKQASLYILQFFIQQRIVVSFKYGK